MDSGQLPGLRSCWVLYETAPASDIWACSGVVSAGGAPSSEAAALWSHEECRCASETCADRKAEAQLKCTPAPHSVPLTSLQLWARHCSDKHDCTARKARLTSVAGQYLVVHAPDSQVRLTCAWKQGRRAA